MIQNKMINKKRNRSSRSEASEDPQECFPSSKCPILLTGKRKCVFFEKSEKYYSMFITSSCYYCKENLGDQIETSQCMACFKSFHQNCYQIIKTPYPRSDSIWAKSKICFLCDCISTSTCINCQVNIKPESELMVKCELCGNLMHYECCGHPLYLLLNREYYTYRIGFPEKNRETLNSFLLDLRDFTEKELMSISDNKKEAYLKFLTKSQTALKINTNHLETLFHICKFCTFNADRPQEINDGKTADPIEMITVIIRKGVAYNLLKFTYLAPIHQIFLIASQFPKNESGKKNAVETKTDNDISMKKILDVYYLNNPSDSGSQNLINTSRAYFLIKWKGKAQKYSFEYSDFIQNFIQFQELYPQFIMSKELEDAFYVDLLLKKIKRFSCKIDMSLNANEKMSLKSLSQKSSSYVSNIVFDEFDVHNIFLLNERTLIDQMRREMLVPLISHLINKHRHAFLKVLICTDEPSLIKKWKESLNLHTGSAKNASGSYLKILSIGFKKYLKVFYEMFFLDITKISSSLMNEISELLSSPNPNETLYKLLENVIIDFNACKFDVLLLPTNYLQVEGGFLSKINFNLVIFDLVDPDSIIHVKNALKMYSEKSRVILLKSLKDGDAEDDFSINFSNFLYTFYEIKDYLIDGSSLFGSYSGNTSGYTSSYNSRGMIKLLNKDKKMFPTKLEDMLTHLKLEYQWSVVNCTLRSSPYNLVKEKTNYYHSIREKNFMNVDTNSYGLIVNFIPVTMSQLDFMQYIAILKERKNTILAKKSENKNDLIKNLTVFCTFPNLMVMYYINKLEEINLKVIDEVNKRKIDTLIGLVKYLVMSSGKNSSRLKIKIVYSEPNWENTDRRQESAINMFKSIINRTIKKNLNFSNVTLHSIENIDEIAGQSDYSGEVLVIILFNVILTSKLCGKFFRVIINNCSTRHIFLFQMYIENSVEQNLIEEFYSNLDYLVPGDDKNFISSLSKETKEIVLKKNFINLRYINSESSQKTLEFEKKVAITQDDKKLPLSQFDGIIVIDESAVIMAKNSTFFRSEFEDCPWECLLEEDFLSGINCNNLSISNSASFNSSLPDPLLSAPSFNTRTTKKKFPEANLIPQKEDLNTKSTVKSNISSCNNSAINSNKKQRIIDDTVEANQGEFKQKCAIDSRESSIKKYANDLEVILLEDEKPKPFSEKVSVDLSKNNTNKFDRDIINEINRNNAKFKDVHTVPVTIAHNSKIVTSIKGFSNLSQINSSSFLYSQTNFKKNGIDFLLSVLSEGKLETTDALCEINYHLIQNGFRLKVREIILELILTFGIDLFHLDEFTSNIAKKVQEKSGEKIHIEHMRFYIEYFISVLRETNLTSGGKSILNSNISSSFLYGNNNCNEIKKRILVMHLIKEMLVQFSEEEIKKKIATILPHFSERNCRVTETTTRLLVNLAFNLLSGVSCFGLDEFKTIAYSSYIKKNLSLPTENESIMKLMEYVCSTLTAEKEICANNKNEEMEKKFICILNDIYQVMENYLLLSN